MAGAPRLLTVGREGETGRQVGQLLEDVVHRNPLLDPLPTTDLKSLSMSRRMTNTTRANPARIASKIE